MLDHQMHFMVGFIFFNDIVESIYYSIGANAGHIPGSINLPYGELFDAPNQCLKSNDDLKKG